MKGCIDRLGFTHAARLLMASPSTASVSSDWLTTLRPRVGFAANNWLVYVTGGLAVANLKSNFSFTDTFAGATKLASISKTKAGWTVGVGTEYARRTAGR